MNKEKISQERSKNFLKNKKNKKTKRVYHKKIIEKEKLSKNIIIDQKKTYKLQIPLFLNSALNQYPLKYQENIDLNY